MTPEEETRLKLDFQALRNDLQAVRNEMIAGFNRVDAQFNKLKILIWLPIITAAVQVFVALHK
jgi:hypothetical protein